MPSQKQPAPATIQFSRELDRRCINSAASENHCIQVFELWYLMPWIEVQSARRTVLSPLCVAQVEVGCGV